jgi:hypothetical protein
MIGRLSKQPPVTFHVWGSRKVIGYLRQYSSNFTRRVQCLGKIEVQVSSKERVLSLEPGILFG